MFEIGLADDACLTVRAAAIVARWKTIECEDSQAAFGGVIGGGAADSAGAEDDDVVGGVNLGFLAAESPFVGTGGGLSVEGDQ
jgi:hypothetical protein